MPVFPGSNVTINTTAGPHAVVFAIVLVGDLLIC
jgi:hypothetical protein